MIIRELELSNFRNYERQNVAFSPGGNVIIGGNGQGKTNLLEAVYFASHLKSNRAPRMRELVMSGRTSASVRAVIIDGEARTSLVIKLGQRGRAVEVNGRAEPASRARGLLKCVMFSPDDLYLVKGDPSVRRGFLDETMEGLGPLAAREVVNFRHILRQRNAVLRNCEERGQRLLELLEPWNESLARSAAPITVARRRMIGGMAETAADCYGRVSGDDGLRVSYSPSFPSPAGDVESEAAPLAQALRDCLREEERARMTLVGPHRDELEIELDGRPARHSASQGEQRSIAFCLRMAQRDCIERETGRTPVLLLDDVMSELDSTRRAGVLKLASSGTGTQSLITTTERPGPGEGPYERLLEVSEGEVRVA